MLKEILIQMSYYGVTMLITILIIGLIQRGFFLNYLRVRASLGRLILIKVREVNRDTYALGEVIENRLEYTYKKEKKLLIVPKDKVIFYRSVGVTMCDVDSDNNNFCTIDYECIPGFDAVKYKNLYTRALTKPSLNDNTAKIQLILIIILLLAVLFLAYSLYNQSKDLKLIYDVVSKLKPPTVSAKL